MSTTPTLYETISAVVEAGLEGVNVSAPAKVLSYDASKQSATVQPQIKRGYVDAEGVRQTESLPAITNVPIVFPGCGAARLTFPIDAGDTVLLIFSHSSLDRWLSVGREVDPGDDRHHALSDAIAIPGLRSFSGAEAAHATATVLYGDDVRIGGEAAQALATKADIDALRSWIMTHTHTGVTTGAGVSGIPSAPAAPSATGTTKAKGE